MLSFCVYIIYSEICIGKADGLPSAYSVIFRLFVQGRHTGRPLRGGIRIYAYIWKERMRKASVPLDIKSLIDFFGTQIIINRI